MTGAWLDQVLTGGLCGESLLLLSLAGGGSHFVPPQTVPQPHNRPVPDVESSGLTARVASPPLPPVDLREVITVGPGLRVQAGGV